MPLPQGVELIAATREHESLLANLAELYVHDFSEFVPVAAGPDGRFHHLKTSTYWDEPNRFPFLLRVDGSPAGFVLVSRGSRISGDPGVWDMAEFFVMRAYRRRGIGVSVAHEVWRRFPGTWEVRVREANGPALVFWQRAVEAFAPPNARASWIDAGERRWRVFSFGSAGRDGMA